jgi:hypothetical protein
MMIPMRCINRRGADENYAKKYAKQDISGNPRHICPPQGGHNKESQKDLYTENLVSGS